MRSVGKPKVGHWSHSVDLLRYESAGLEDRLIIGQKGFAEAFRRGLRLINPVSSDRPISDEENRNWRQY
ncbi:hypothetical protein [Mesorhizobium sp. M0040]|uniref:hypothetical protein n=1 Tax=Mesorhizobium sp. M0040 TaxID=2956855 RepID=UPI003336269C